MRGETGGGTDKPGVLTGWKGGVTDEAFHIFLCVTAWQHANCTVPKLSNIYVVLNLKSAKFFVRL